MLFTADYNDVHNRREALVARAEPPYFLRAMTSSELKFGIGRVVRHRLFPFRGVVFDVDPEFSNTDEWWESIPEDIRPRKDQPFYHLLAENEESTYIAYVSQQNLLPDNSGEPVDHPQVDELFDAFDGSNYRLRRSVTH